MHHTAYVNAEKFYHKYCENNIEDKKILDVGSYDVNGTMKPIFEKGQYVGLDMEAGPNVDIVGVSHDIPFEKDEFDIIISSSCFEHDDMFWISFQEMCRVLKPGGILICLDRFHPNHLSEKQKAYMLNVEYSNDFKNK